MKKIITVSLLALVAIVGVAQAEDSLNTSAGRPPEVRPLPKPPVRQEFRNIASTTRAEVKGIREEARGFASTTRGELRDNRGEIKDLRGDIRNSSSTASTTRAELRDEIKKKMEEQKNLRKDLVENRMKAELEKVHALTGARIAAALERAKNIDARIASRIEKIKAEGTSTTETEALLATARAKSQAAEAKIAEFKTNIDSLISSNDVSTTTRATIKDATKSVKDAIKEVYDAYKLVVNSIK